MAAYVVAITALSHQSSLTIPGGTDWMWHGIEYAGLGALVGRAAEPRRRGARVLLVAAAGCAAFAALDEFHQASFPAGTPRRWMLWRTPWRHAGADGHGPDTFPSPQTTQPVPEIEITLYGRRDCHLCDDAERIVEQVAGGYPVRIRKIDIDTDPELGRLYSEQVPVILVNGRKVAKLHVDPGLRRRIVSLLEGSS